MNKTTKTIKKIYNSSLFWILISLIASLIIWIYVTSIQSDEYHQIFRDVPVEFVGSDVLRNTKGMVITDAGVSTVTVEISGPRRVIASLASSDLVAQIDVSRLSQSIYTSQQYTVIFPDGTDTSNITVLKKTPETISFTVSSVIEKTVQVKGSFQGEIAEGYIAQKIVFDPATITLKGPDAYLKDVEYVWLTFGDSVIETTYTEETGFTLMDANGEECSTNGISFSSETITATVPILAVKEIPLDVYIHYDAGATEENTLVTITPKSIQLSGDSALLSDINKIMLDTIDTTSFTTTFQDKYPIKISNELNNMTGVTEATVNVEIVGLDTKTFTVQNITASNVPEGFEANVITQQMSVRIRGSRDVISSLINENITLIADLSDISATAGVFNVPVKVRIDGTNEAGAIGEYSVSVELRKEEE